MANVVTHGILDLNGGNVTALKDVQDVIIVVAQLNTSTQKAIGKIRPKSRK